MGIARGDLHAAIHGLGAIEPRIAAAVQRVGLPEPRIGRPGYETLIRSIVSQQVSIKAAAAIWGRVDAVCGGAADPAKLIAVGDADLRAAGLSWGKVSYAKSLADEVLSGRLDLAALPADDEAAIAQLTRVKGIGRWSAEIYLLFAEGRTDAFPAGDLAVQIEIGNIMGLDGRPTEKQTRAIAEAWRPHRGPAAIFAWHHRHMGDVLPT